MLATCYLSNPTHHAPDSEVFLILQLKMRPRINVHKARLLKIVQHRGDGKSFVVRADEKLTAFVELERAVHEFAVNSIL